MARYHSVPWGVAVGNIVTRGTSTCLRLKVNCANYQRGLKEMKNELVDWKNKPDYNRKLSKIAFINNINMYGNQRHNSMALAYHVLM